MNRRDVLGGLLALPAICGASPAFSQAARPFRITLFPDMIPLIRGMLSDAIRAAGWTEGKDVVVVQSGFQQDSPQVEQAARRVVDSRPDAILTYSSNFALVLHRVTTTIPIVMWTSGYPVEVGLANSLARPGKNVTGNTQYAGTGLWGKLLELLSQAKPGIKRVGAYWGYVPPAFPKEEIEPCYRELRQAAHSLSMTLNIVEVATPDALAAALAKIDGGKPEALLLTSNPVLWNVRQQVMTFAEKRRLPTVVDFVWPVTDRPYPLLTYSPPTTDLIGRAVGALVRIRKGIRPGDLPIQLPAKFDLIVNRTTAKSIALTLPPALLARADRVIE